MKNMFRLTVALTALVFSLPSLRAEGTAPAATEPELTISLPTNLKIEDVVGAVTKAFTGLNWIGVAAQNDTVVAFIDHHGVKVKATAVCTVTEIKVFTDYKGAGKVTPEKAKANVDRWLRYLEKNTREELGLLPKKGEKNKKAD
jgi:hypothetical protein